jgi:hypothetical protein
LGDLYAQPICEFSPLEAASLPVYESDCDSVSDY